MKFIINGGKALDGDIRVGGCKNSATPIIAATLLTDQTCILHNIPRIGDVLVILEILKSIGSRQKWLSGHSIEIDNSDINPEKLDQNLMCQIRSSILLVGPLLARFGKVSFVTPGGCKIGSRPIDTHLEAFRDLGAIVEFDDGSGIHTIFLKNFKNDRVCLKEFSVTATENLLMLAKAHPFAIALAAIEPHVLDLIDFLAKLGVTVAGDKSHTFKVNSGKGLSGAIEHTIINDPIEAGTLAVLASATRSNINIVGVEESHLELPLRKLKEFGVVFNLRGSVLGIDGMRSGLHAAKIQTLPYPGLPTDLQAPFGVLATQAKGSSLIFDIMYEGRLKYIDELRKMGADAVILDPHRAIINGPTVLHGAEIQSLDLRAGATLVIAALVAKGQSAIGSIEQIDRGYEKFDERLRELGADIIRSD
ncbi:MAG: UDP-N-acetylglucosamine 1-carboxyvinyltransferase [Candidatus Harrisonbacteria bacterium]|nr:UDP-N-acetylglucosamine 1-carboxyvinyltransferase [Candidatus Harrisonbacteria bacterium]